MLSLKVPWIYDALPGSSYIVLAITSRQRQEGRGGGVFCQVIPFGQPHQGRPQKLPSLLDICLLLPWGLSECLRNELPLFARGSVFARVPFTLRGVTRGDVGCVTLSACVWSEALALRWLGVAESCDSSRTLL